MKHPLPKFSLIVNFFFTFASYPKVMFAAVLCQKKGDKIVPVFISNSS